jgi:hypothetical protein
MHTILFLATSPIIWAFVGFVVFCAWAGWRSGPLPADMLAIGTMDHLIATGHHADLEAFMATGCDPNFLEVVDPSAYLELTSIGLLAADDDTEDALIATL